MDRTMLNEMAASLRAATSNQAGKTIVITGSSSGIGLYAAKLLRVANPQHRLILVARTMEKAEDAVKQVESVTDKVCEQGSRTIPLACDHSSIKSVRDFCAELRRKVKSDYHNQQRTTIDVLCLNAATLAKSNVPDFTDDGLERTFQTNHLAPFLIANLTRDLIDPNGRVVVTGSGLHKGPTFGSFRGMMDPNTHKAKSGFATVDGKDFHFKQAYASSKLCNAAFFLALNRRLQQRSNACVANSFTPGLMPESGLFRNQNPYFRTAFSFAMKNIARSSNSVEWGGGALAWMATADEAGKRGGEYWQAPMGASQQGAKYGNEFCPSEIAEEALDEDNQETLWELSSQLGGIQKDTF